MGRFGGCLQFALRAAEVSRGDKLEGGKVADGGLPPTRPCRSDEGVNECKQVNRVDEISNECEVKEGRDARLL